MTLLGLTVAIPAHAYADDDDEEKPKRRGLIVTVEDNDDVDAGIKRKKGATSLTPPADDASESEINAYLRELKKDVRDTQLAAKEAARAGDADEAIRLKEELRDKKALLKDEESRLMSRDVGLIAGGGVLTGLGGLSLLSSVVLLCVWGFSSLDGDPEEEYGWGALGTVGGAALGLGAGIPMIVVGRKKEPRGYDDADTYGRLPSGGAPRVGLSVGFSF